MKIAILGAGNMGGATAIGLAKSEIGKSLAITVTARHDETFKKFAGLDINTSLDNNAACKDSDYVFLVVKPWLVKSVVEEILPNLDFSKQAIVCMAAGIQSQDLLEWLGTQNGTQPSLTYIIPNTAIEIGESMSFIAPVTSSQAQVEELKSLFDAVGSTIITDEKHLAAGTALASCGIAYALRYIRAASEGGVQLGFKASDAQNIVAQTVKGAASLLMANGTHAEAEIDKVTTPGGITIKGLNAMEESGFTAAVINGLLSSK